MCINMAARQVTLGYYYTTIATDTVDTTIAVEREMRFFSDAAEGSRWSEKLSGRS